MPITEHEAKIYQVGSFWCVERNGYKMLDLSLEQALEDSGLPFLGEDTRESIYNRGFNIGYEDGKEDKLGELKEQGVSFSAGWAAGYEEGYEAAKRGDQKLSLDQVEIVAEAEETRAEKGN